mgnify:CR=1 FL=1
MLIDHLPRTNYWFCDRNENGWSQFTPHQSIPHVGFVGPVPWVLPTPGACNGFRPLHALDKHPCVSCYRTPCRQTNVLNVSKSVFNTIDRKRIDWMVSPNPCSASKNSTRPFRSEASQRSWEKGFRNSSNFRRRSHSFQPQAKSSRSSNTVPRR